ncbi:uncharacterized protein DEA37_0009349 [Paragonimus westermani]|uniref:Uncharacterized protein n=1 Tax=Paragonimus westermani TaxID=34504 RepID=A0A5J4NVL5_9TREM|nr:uncharacterized protein DEA37_0009349 [Paragonimus westermani]
MHDHWKRHLVHSPEGFNLNSDKCDKPGTNSGNRTQTRMIVQKGKLLKSSRLHREESHRRDWIILRNASLLLFIIFSVIFIFLDIFYLINPASKFLGPPSQNAQVHWQNTRCRSAENTKNCDNIQTHTDQPETGWRVLSRSTQFLRDPSDMKHACRNTSISSKS